MKMISKLFRIPKTTDKALKQLAKKLGKSEAELIRQALQKTYQI